MDISLFEVLLGSATAPSDGQAGGPAWITCLMPVAFLGIFYALLIRPQQQQQKQHAKMVEELKNGDRVIASGMVGTVVTVKQKTITLRTGESKLELMRTSVERVLEGDDDLNS